MVRKICSEVAGLKSGMLAILSDVYLHSQLGGKREEGFGVNCLVGGREVFRIFCRFCFCQRCHYCQGYCRRRHEGIGQWSDDMLNERQTLLNAQSRHLIVGFTKRSCTIFCSRRYERGRREKVCGQVVFGYPSRRTSCLLVPNHLCV